MAKPQRACIAISLLASPLAPWLRLAHRTDIGSDASGRGVVRWCDDYMLMLQLEGTSYIWLHELEGSVALPAGAIAFVPPRVVHAWGVCTGAHIAVHFDLHAQSRLEPLDMLHHRDQWISPRQLPSMPYFALEWPGARTDPLRIPLVTPLRRPVAFRERLDPLIAMYGARNHRSLSARLRATEILAWAVQSLADERPDASAAAIVNPRILALLSELDSDCARPWSVGALARRVGMGATAFRRAFIAAVGSPPHAHLEALRMDRAARLLVDTDGSVASIAAAVGYDDPYHFSRVFRRVTGKPPRAARTGSARGRGV
ncbi:MAG: helix-turn-helix transcriptional regulator [Planctomycetes bacterium]|nr:helix-turn-helix transcriptional regulator [Planctomycetota bacterium]